MNSPYGTPPRIDASTGRGPAGGATGGRGGLPGPVARVLGVIAGTVVAISALFVSVVAFAAVLVVGAVAAGWLWWKTRDVRRQLRGEMERMQQAMERGAPFEPGSPLNRGGRGAQDDVIEGDFIREAPADRQDRPDSTTGDKPR